MAASEFPIDSYDLVVDDAIAHCGGDLRSAVRALLIANEYLETELSQLRDFTNASLSIETGSRGYLN